MLNHFDELSSPPGLRSGGTPAARALPTGLPDGFKLRRGITKYVVRKAFADMLPQEILRRGKKGFGVPLDAWFRGELRPYLHETLLSSRALARDYLNLDYVRDLLREHAEGIRDHGHRLWALLTFEVWLQSMQRS